MKFVELVTPQRTNEATGMLTSPMQSQSQTAINETGSNGMADVDISPKISPMRRHEADQHTSGDGLL